MAVAGCEGGTEGSGGVGEGGDGVGGQGCGEAGRIEDGGVVRGEIEDAEVLEIWEHGLLVGGKVGGRVGEAEFHGRDKKEEREDVDFGHSFGSLGQVNVEEEEGPDLGVDILEDKGEAFFCDFRRVAPTCGAGKLDEVTSLEEMYDARRRLGNIVAVFAQWDGGGTNHVA